MKINIGLLYCIAVCVAASVGAPRIAEAASERTGGPPAVVKPALNVSGQLDAARALLDGYRGNGRDLEAARVKLDAILQKDSRNAAAHREYARYFIMGGHVKYDSFQSGSLQAAENSIKKALEINPNFAEAYVLAGHLYLLMQRVNDAFAALTKAEAIGTSDPWLDNNWGDVLLAVGQYDNAVRRYEKVVNSGTPNRKAMTKALSGLVEVPNRLDEFDAADTAYQKLLAYDPNNAWEHGNYAHFLLCRRDDYDAALTEIRRALKIMNYGAGKETLAAALSRRWAAQILKGESGATELTAMSKISAASHEQNLIAKCGVSSRATKAVQSAIQPADKKSR